MSWPEVAELLIHYSGYELYGDKGKYYPNRIKQWFGYLRRQYSEADILFKQLRVLHDPDAIVSLLRQEVVNHAA